MSIKTPQDLPSLLSKHRKGVDLLRKIVQQNLPDLSPTPTSPLNPASASDSASSVLTLTLKDGTIIDDIFYLRYVMSAKEPLTSENVVESETYENVIACLKWRQEQGFGIEDDIRMKNCKDGKKEERLMKKIPFCRTGEVAHGFPIAVLPVNEVDFEMLFKSHGHSDKLEEEILDFFLVQKERIFREIDHKSRQEGKLIKSITVYDLNGMSFSSIYKLTKFFKLVAGHSKKFKAYYPQSTHSTVILNSPGTWVLKMFSKSKKQKIMGVDEFLVTYDAKQAVPKFLNGTAPWPLDGNYVADKSAFSKLKKKLTGDFNVAHPHETINFAVHGDEIRSIVTVNSANHSSPNSVKTEEFSNPGLAPFHAESPVEKSSIPTGVPVQTPVLHARPNLVFNKKVGLTMLEREMVQLRKNKVFSIDVLEHKQEVSLFFVNNKSKAAHLLLAVKEERPDMMFNGNQHVVSEKMYTVINSQSVLQPGFNHLKLHVQNPGEILLIYVNRDKYTKNNLHDIESMKLKKKGAKTLAKRGLKHVRKNIEKNAKTLAHLGRSKSFDGFIEASNVHRLAEKEAERDDDKVFFRFEVSDTIVAGEFEGRDDFDDMLLEPDFNVVMSSPGDNGVNVKTKLEAKPKWSKNADGLIDFEDGRSSISGKSTMTYSSLLNQRNISPRGGDSLLRSVGALFGF